MIVTFIIVGGFVLQCVLNTTPSETYCSIANMKTFGALVSAGALELVFEFRGLISIFQRKDKGDK